MVVHRWYLGGTRQYIFLDPWCGTIFKLNGFVYQILIVHSLVLHSAGVKWLFG